MRNILCKDKLTPAIIQILHTVFLQIDEPDYLNQIKQNVIAKIKPSRCSSTLQSENLDVSYNPNVELFEDVSQLDTQFTGIMLTNKRQQKTQITVDIISNLIANISYDNAEFKFVEVTSIDTAKCHKHIIKVNDSIKNLLRSVGITDNASPSQVYFMDIEGQDYLHIKQLGDGDCIVLFDKHLYWFAHDFDVPKLVPKEIETVIKPKLLHLSFDAIIDLLD